MENPQNPSEAGSFVGNRPEIFVGLLLGLLGCCMVLAPLVFFLQPANIEYGMRFFYTSTPVATRTTTPTLTFTSTPTNSATPTITFTPTITLTPTITPTPYSYVSVPSGADVFHDNFSKNNYAWRNYSGTILAINGGFLRLRSQSSDKSGMVSCGLCPLANPSFYFQAEVFLLEKSNKGHGLAYCINQYGGNKIRFYVYQIDNDTRAYSLYKYVNEKWALLVQRTFSETIAEYPAHNTVGVDFDHGKMDLYINGSLVRSYSDEEPISNCMEGGFYIDGGTINMGVDNVFVHTTGK